MGAARYIGRVGGLAVALGVGTAIVTGQGVASATTGTDEKSTTEAPSTTNGSDPGTSNGNGSVKIKKGPRVLGIFGRHSADPTTPKSTLATSIVDRLTEKPTKKTPRLSLTDRIAARNSGDNAQTNNDPDTNKGVNNDISVAKVVVEKAVTPKALDWLKSPAITAGRTQKATAPLSSLWTPPSAQSIAPLQAPQRISSLITTVVGDVLSPFAGNSPLAPPTDSPLSWIALAASRKEFSTGTLTTQARTVATTKAVVTMQPAAPSATTPPSTWGQLAAVLNELSGAAVSLVPANPITVNPTLTFDDGIIDGSANATDANGLPLAYTIVSNPSQGGKITFIPEEAPGTFSYLPYATVLTSGTEKFSELVSETTPFDTTLEGLPLVGTLVQPILVQLYQVPGVNTALAPLIGAAVVVPFTADPSALNPKGAPAAFTVKVASFDGTLISTNFYPASGLKSGQSAPSILEGPGLGSPGVTDPESQTGILSVPGLVPGIAPLRDAGYNVVTWDPRGEFASGGVLQLDSPAFEGKDVSSIITYLLSLPETKDNKRIGMVGGSYGGGIQLVSAAIDPRIDAIVPGIAWNTLNSSLYPNQGFKTAWAAILTLDLVEAGATINPQIYSGVLTGALLGILTPSQQALLANSGPGSLVSDITVPTLLVQGTVDGLFPLQEAVTNAQLLAANNVPVKTIWFCGGHGICLDPPSPTQSAIILKDTLAWLNQYVKQDPSDPADAIPTFQWVDQNGNFFSSDLMPSNPSFQGAPISASGAGGILLAVPIIGGSGPQSEVLQLGLSPLVAALLSAATAAPATNALNLTVPVATGTQIVGAPQLTFTYSGIGTSRTVYAQIVDNQTGLVLGNLATPIPVTLDGQTHTVSIALGTLADVAYTAASPNSTLTLQLVGSATQYENLTSFGVINVSNMALSLPTVE